MRISRTLPAAAAAVAQRLPRQRLHHLPRLIQPFTPHTEASHRMGWGAGAPGLNNVLELVEGAASADGGWVDGLGEEDFRPGVADVAEVVAGTPVAEEASVVAVMGRVSAACARWWGRGQGGESGDGGERGRATRQCLCAGDRGSAESHCTEEAAQQVTGCVRGGVVVLQFFEEFRVGGDVLAFVEVEGAGELFQLDDVRQVGFGEAEHGEGVGGTVGNLSYLNGTPAAGAVLAGLLSGGASAPVCAT